MPNQSRFVCAPTIDQVIGQELVGPGKIIRRMVEANRLAILYGLQASEEKPVSLQPSLERQVCFSDLQCHC